MTAFESLSGPQREAMLGRQKADRGTRKALAANGLIEFDDVSGYQPVTLTDMGRLVLFQHERRNRPVSDFKPGDRVVNVSISQQKGAWGIYNEVCTVERVGGALVFVLSPDGHEMKKAPFHLAHVHELEEAGLDALIAFEVSDEAIADMAEAFVEFKRQRRQAEPAPDGAESEAEMKLLDEVNAQNERMKAHLDQSEAPAPAPAEPVVLLPLDQITVYDGTQTRLGTDPATVQDYADDMAKGDLFPPIDVFHAADDHYWHWLADGFHRVAAAKLAGIPNILARVHIGSRRDAILFGLRANATHGLRRSNLDKHHAVELLLLDAEWALWSDGEIARHAGVSQPFVSKLRRELAEAHPATQNGFESTERKGADGRVINTANIGRKAAEAELPGPIPPFSSLMYSAGPPVQHGDVVRHVSPTHLSRGVEGLVFTAHGPVVSVAWCSWDYEPDSSEQDHAADELVFVRRIDGPIVVDEDGILLITDAMWDTLDPTPVHAPLPNDWRPHAPAVETAALEGMIVGGLIAQGYTYDPATSVLSPPSNDEGYDDEPAPELVDVVNPVTAEVTRAPADQPPERPAKLAPALEWRTAQVYGHPGLPPMGMVCKLGSGQYLAEDMRYSPSTHKRFFTHAEAVEWLEQRLS
jgi:hypothetical protein